MKKSIITILTLCAFMIACNESGQKKVHGNSKNSGSGFYNRLKAVDLSKILLPDTITDDANEKYPRAEILGFIDTNYQRFQIHFTSITKRKDKIHEYYVTGKTKVRENICSFTGTISVDSAVLWDSTLTEIGFPTYIPGYIVSHIQLEEDSISNNSGRIEGDLLTAIYITDKGNIEYDALMLIADGFSNNEFRGTWTSYKTGRVKKCNWGDYRIPESGNLDFGAGEFSPNEEYLKNGWENLKKAWIGNPDDKGTIEARKQEENWWK